MSELVLVKNTSTIPAIPDTWTYEESIKKIQPLVYKWKNLTVEVAEELYIARQMLSKEGRPEKTDANAPVFTWNKYCTDIGIAKSTANRWLQQFYPQEKQIAVESVVDDSMCAVDDLHKLIQSGQKFKTIMADPPWSYSNQATRASTDNHYMTMMVEDICNLPIIELAEDNAHLHLWTTNAFLFEAKEVMESWGFEYKSVFLWIKPSMGIGNYWRVSHEFMLFGLRGNEPFRNHSEMSWFTEKRSQHSKKPHSIVKKIENVSPAPYLELFGRQTREGWTVWGNEIERTLFNKGAF